MLFSKNKPLVGLDVGSSSIKAVELAKSKSGYEIVGFGSQALPPDIVVDGAITDAGSVSAGTARSQMPARSRKRSRPSAGGVCDASSDCRPHYRGYRDGRAVRDGLGGGPDPRPDPTYFSGQFPDPCRGSRHSDGSGSLCTPSGCMAVASRRGGRRAIAAHRLEVHDDAILVRLI